MFVKSTCFKQVYQLLLSLIVASNFKLTRTPTTYGEHGKIANIP